MCLILCRSCQAKISDVSVFAQTESVPQRKSGVSQRFCAKVSSPAVISSVPAFSLSCRSQFSSNKALSVVPGFVVSGTENLPARRRSGVPA